MQAQRLSRHRQLQCCRLLQENAYAYACVEFLSVTLVENGVVATRGGAKASPEFQAIVDKYYLQFVKDCLVSCMVYGFVAWDTQKIDKMLVPVVLPGTHITVEVEWPKGAHIPLYVGRYTITDKLTRFFEMVYAPDLVHSVIDSPLCKVLPYHAFEILLLQNAARADRRNADTPLVLENTAGSPGFWALGNLVNGKQGYIDAHQGLTSGGDPTFDDISSALGCEVESRMSCVDETMVRLQDGYVKDLNTIGELDALQQSKLYKDTEQKSLPRLQLPPHTKVQGVTFPATRNDLKDLLRMNQQRICVSLGVPPEILIKDHHVKLDQTQSQHAVAQRVTELRKIIQPILTKALRICTKGDDFVWSLLTGEKCYTIAPDIEIQPQLPPTQELVDLHEIGLLPTTFMRDHISRKYGFDVSDYKPSNLKPQPDPNLSAKRAKTSSSSQHGGGGGGGRGD